MLSLNSGMGKGCGILGYKKNKMIKEITETKKRRQTLPLSLGDRLGVNICLVNCMK